MTDYRCSFCDKRQDQVKKLIAGPKGVYICDECVALCTEIIANPPSAPAATTRRSQGSGWRARFAGRSSLAVSVCNGAGTPLAARA